MVKKIWQKQQLVAIILAALTAPAAADPSGAPPVTTVGYRDWLVECADVPCRLSTSVEGADGTPVVLVSLDGPEEAVALAVTTRLAVFVPDGMMLSVGEDPDRLLAWRVCGPDGCEARLPADPDLIAALKRAPDGRVTLTLSDGTPIRLAFSLRGFTGAWRLRNGW